MNSLFIFDSSSNGAISISKVLKNPNLLIRVGAIGLQCVDRSQAIKRQKYFVVPVAMDFESHDDRGTKTD